MAATIVTVIASVRAAVHRPVAGVAGLDDAGLVAWANEELPPLYDRIADDIPAYFEKVSADVAVAEGTSTIVVTGAPLSLADFRKVRFVEVKTGSVYLPMRWAPGIASSFSSGLAGTYRVRYLPKAITISGAGDTTDLGLPAGLERSLIETLAGRVRRRFNEDDRGHVTAAAKAYKECVRSLLRLQGMTAAVPPWDSMVRWPRWRFRGPATVELVGGW